MQIRQISISQTEAHSSTAAIATAALGSPAADPVVRMMRRARQAMNMMFDADEAGLRATDLAEKHRHRETEEAATNELTEIERQIGETPCSTLEGALVHVMFALSWSEPGGDDKEADAERCRRADFVLTSALKVLLQATGFDLQSVLGEYFLTDDQLSLLGDRGEAPPTVAQAAE